MSFPYQPVAGNRGQTKKNGVDYYFISEGEFRKRIKRSEFVEWEEVYDGCFYGTLKQEVERIWAAGNHVIFDVDVKGGLNIKKNYTDICLSLFIQPPSLAELERRLRGRMTDSEERIQQRLKKSVYELTFAKHFDRIIINDNLDQAVQEAHNAIATFIEK